MRTSYNWFSSVPISFSWSEDDPSEWRSSSAWLWSWWSWTKCQNEKNPKYWGILTKTNCFKKVREIKPWSLTLRPPYQRGLRSWCQKVILPIFSPIQIVSGKICFRGNFVLIPPPSPPSPHPRGMMKGVAGVTGWRGQRTRSSRRRRSKRRYYW